MQLGTYDHYVYALVALLGTGLAVWFLSWITLRSPWAGEIRTWKGMSPPFLGVVGVLFALTLAFLANDTWNAHDRALNAVHQEGDALRNLKALAAPLPEASRRTVEAAIADYARVTVGQEWPLLAQRLSSPEAAARLDSLLALLSGEDIARASSPGAHALMLAQVTQARVARGMRIALSRTHVNPLKWLGMAGLGFLTLISIAMVHVEMPRASVLAMLVFAAAAAPTAAIVLVQGNPFQPPSVITDAPIRSLVPS